MDELEMASAVETISSGLGFNADSNTDAIDVETKEIPDAPALNAPAGDAAANADGVGTGVDGSKSPPEGTPAPAPGPGDNPPPQTWRGPAAAKWAAIDPEVQAEILKREADIHSGLSSYKADATFGKSMQQAVAPFQQVLQRFGIDPAAHTHALMQAHHTLAMGSPDAKLQMLRTLARDYAIDVSKLDPANAPYVDPAVEDLRRNNHALESRLQSIETARQTEVRTNIESSVEAFFKDSRNTYVNEVYPNMAKLLETGVAKDLQDAYDQAIYLNPQTRVKEIARLATEQSKSEAKAKAEAAAKSRAHAQGARSATAANIVSGAKSSSATAATQSLDDTLKETLAKIEARSS